MTIPSDPHASTARDPYDAAATPEQSTPLGPGTAGTSPTPAFPPDAPAQPVAATPPTPVPADESEESGPGVPAKVTAAAVVAGAAALANKIRKEAPNKIREAREKGVAGRYVILTEVDARPVAIGPYRKEEAARRDSAHLAGPPQVVELKSRAAHFGLPRSESTT